VEFIIVATTVVMSVLLALGSTRVVLWMVMLGIMRDALPQPAVDGILPRVSVIHSE
jgi:hypothetical protein